ncbi:hypothetical protein BDN71DRAFT_1433388 [Pleurotus eryngii]|uniref:Uncharacterized protein n=1 Tax=Pleurotus eryngii TaxID=5323 RepID=A0A9P6D4E0_PLEER|nr:hypothetical protein BDN71DRAFT_1433388 [Pleurotus eryngii]
MSEPMFAHSSNKAIPLHETDPEEENTGMSSSLQMVLDQHMELSAFVKHHLPPSPGLSLLPMLDEKSQDSFLGKEKEISQAEPLTHDGPGEVAMLKGQVARLETMLDMMRLELSELVMCRICLGPMKLPVVLLCSHTSCSLCLDVTFQTQIHDAQVLHKIIEENLHEAGPVPSLFQHPCLICQASVLQHPLENYFAKGIIEWLNQQSGACDSAQGEMEQLDPPLFDSLFLDI